MALVHISAALRRFVVECAHGQCEYCGIAETVVFVPHEIDHIIAQKHDGQTEANNLALSCAVCNKRKGSDIASIDPETGQVIPLYHPRRERWPEHFHLDGSRIVALTPTGRVTIRLLQLNHPDRIAERELLLIAGQYSFPFQA
jgi:hypothetical protein